MTPRALTRRYAHQQSEDRAGGAILTLGCRHCLTISKRAREKPKPRRGSSANESVGSFTPPRPKSPPETERIGATVIENICFLLMAKCKLKKNTLLIVHVIPPLHVDVTHASLSGKPLTYSRCFASALDHKGASSLIRATIAVNK
jgi:hypothetical protein